MRTKNVNQLTRGDTHEIEVHLRSLTYDGLPIAVVNVAKAYLANIGGGTYAGIPNVNLESDLRGPSVFPTHVMVDQHHIKLWHECKDRAIAFLQRVEPPLLKEIERLENEIERKAVIQEQVAIKAKQLQAQQAAAAREATQIAAQQRQAEAQKQAEAQSLAAAQLKAAYCNAVKQAFLHEETMSNSSLPLINGKLDYLKVWMVKARDEYGVPLTAAQNKLIVDTQNIYQKEMDRQAAEAAREAEEAKHAAIHLAAQQEAARQAELKQQAEEAKRTAEAARLAEVQRLAQAEALRLEQEAEDRKSV